MPTDELSRFDRTALCQIKRINAPASASRHNEERRPDRPFRTFRRACTFVPRAESSSDDTFILARKTLSSCCTDDGEIAISPLHTTCYWEIVGPPHHLPIARL